MSRQGVRPVGFAFAETPEQCIAMGIQWQEGGWGLMLCTDDETGERTTRLIDPSFLRLLVGTDPHTADGAFVPPKVTPLETAGWPEDWDLTAPVVSQVWTFR